DSWPTFDEAYLVQDTVTIVVQINGKVRANISAPTGSSQDEVEELAKKDNKVTEHTKPGIKKVIYVPNKLINFVV
ncbi:hypothetical protein KC950_04130, partial [Candidatus Saccharibacteria bacterium]|nr:hypothetical protein [Candidatus Saccharibacteria bacterium]